MGWKTQAKESDSLVSEMSNGPSGIPSIMGLEEPLENQGGPSSKAKYSAVTDSELVP